MKRIAHFGLVLSVLLVGMAGCGRSGPLSTPTPNAQATIDAAVAATMTTQASMQSAIGAAVNATLTAVAAQATPTPQVETVTLTEEELATMIDAAVAEAAAATAATASASEQATADGAVTQEEVITVQVEVVGAEEAIAYAEELLTLYDDMYGELATETLVLLQAVEDDLAAMAQSTAEVAAALDEIATALEQGMALAEETITQLETAAQAAGAKAAQIQAQNQAWYTALATKLEARATKFLGVVPDAVAADRLGAIQDTFYYLDTVRAALDDSKLSAAELSDIAQLGANAAAGLQAQGGPQLQALSGSVNQITEQLARGQLTQARASLGALEQGLGERPTMPSRPSRPSRP
jgi:predicted small lipoprotein YifL/DNA repair exonuclease SbcCD ATPase subunit